MRQEFKDFLKGQGRELRQYAEDVTAREWLRAEPDKVWHPFAWPGDDRSPLGPWYSMAYDEMIDLAIELEYHSPQEQDEITASLIEMAESEYWARLSQITPEQVKEVEDDDRRATETLRATLGSALKGKRRPT